MTTTYFPHLEKASEEGLEQPSTRSRLVEETQDLRVRSPIIIHEIPSSQELEFSPSRFFVEHFESQGVEVSASSLQAPLMELVVLFFSYLPDFLGLFDLEISQIVFYCKQIFQQLARSPVVGVSCPQTHPLDMRELVRLLQQLL